MSWKTCSRAHIVTLWIHIDLCLVGPRTSIELQQLCKSLTIPLIDSSFPNPWPTPSCRDDRLGRLQTALPSFASAHSVEEAPLRLSLCDYTKVLVLSKSFHLWFGLVSCCGVNVYTLGTGKVRLDPSDFCYTWSVCLIVLEKSDRLETNDGIGIIFQHWLSQSSVSGGLIVSIIFD